MINLAELTKQTATKIEKQTRGLHWNQRPLEIQQAIDDAFNRISNHACSQWGLANGHIQYELGDIDDRIVIEKLILQQLNKGQTEFVFMDIGAGNFQWGRYVTNFLNTHPLFKDRIRVSIYSLRGERNDNAPMKLQGICTLYEYGNFKIENLVAEFARLKHDNLSNKVDLIVSSWCFRHLVDPTGTLLQAYELLKLNTGMIFVDGFFLETVEQRFDYGGTYYYHIRKLFANFNAPVFMKHNDSSHRLNWFIMQKATIEPNIPLIYKDCRYVRDWGIGSERVTTFIANADWKSGLFMQESCVPKYSILSKDSETFFQQQMDHSEITRIKQQKLAELLEKVVKITDKVQLNVCLMDIKVLAQNLISADKNELERIVNDVFKLKPELAGLILNYMTQDTYSFLWQVGGCCNYEKIVFPLFKRLVEVATPEVLNSMNGGINTLLMEAVDGEAVNVIDLLLSSPHIDVQVVNDSSKTALTIVREKIDRLQEEITIVMFDQEVKREQRKLEQLKTIEAKLLKAIAFKQQSVKVQEVIATLPAFALHREELVTEVTSATSTLAQQQVVQPPRPSGNSL